MATVFSGQRIRRRRKNYLRETGSSNYFAGSFLLISLSSTSLRCRAASPSSRMLGILVTEVGFPKFLRDFGIDTDAFFWKDNIELPIIMLN